MATSCAGWLAGWLAGWPVGRPGRALRTPQSHAWPALCPLSTQWGGVRASKPPAGAVRCEKRAAGSLKRRTGLSTQPREGQVRPQERPCLRPAGRPAPALAPRQPVPPRCGGAGGFSPPTRALTHAEEGPERPGRLPGPGQEKKPCVDLHKAGTGRPCALSPLSGVV